MIGTNGSQRPDVNEKKAVHGVFRDTLAAAPKLVGAVDPADAERRELVANFYDNVLSFLHAHHQTEEDLYVPLLRERCPADLDVVDQVVEQHREVLNLVDVAESSLSAWGSGEADAQQRCSDDLSKLGESLAAHLDEEEEKALPLCADHLSVEEWAAAPGHAMGLYQGDKVWLILGLIRERMTQSQRDEMLANMPPPAVEMWTSFGERSFKELISQVGAPLG